MITREHVAHELGELVDRETPLRQSDEEITFFKSVGNAVQDMVVASLAVERAGEMGIGQQIALD
jgi:ornithine cyclodeaminase